MTEMTEFLKSTVDTFVEIVVLFFRKIKMQNQIKKSEKKKQKKKTKKKPHKKNQREIQSSEEKGGKRKKELKKINNKLGSLCIKAAAAGIVILLICVVKMFGVEWEKAGSLVVMQGEMRETEQSQIMETATEKDTEMILADELYDEVNLPQNNTTVFYGTTCKMQLTNFDKVHISEAQEKTAFFNINLEDPMNEEDGTSVKKELLYRLNQKRQNEMDTLSTDEQERILSITALNDDFFSRVDNAKENPAAWPGTEQWYKALPEVSELLNIIEMQTDIFEYAPDIQLANQLSNNWRFIALECQAQETDAQLLMDACAMAIYWLLEKLSFEDINHSNAYKTIRDLKNMYSIMQECVAYVGLTIIGNAIDEFIEEHLNSQIIDNDPIILATKENT